LYIQKKLPKGAEGGGERSREEMLTSRNPRDAYRTKKKGEKKGKEKGGGGLSQKGEQPTRGKRESWGEKEAQVGCQRDPNGKEGKPPPSKENDEKQDREEKERLRKKRREAGKKRGTRLEKKEGPKKNCGKRQIAVLDERLQELLNHKRLRRVTATLKKMKRQKKG